MRSMRASTTRACARTGSRLSTKRERTGSRTTCPTRVRFTAFRSRSRTTSTSPACRRRARVRLLPMCLSVAATVVERLEAAGAILIGKTNLDQFATGLNGTRSPYGIPASTFNCANTFPAARVRDRRWSSRPGSRVVFTRYRHRRIGPGASGVQQHRRTEADEGHHLHAWCRARLQKPGRRFDLCSDGRCSRGRGCRPGRRWPCSGCSSGGPRRTAAGPGRSRPPWPAAGPRCPPSGRSGRPCRGSLDVVDRRAEGDGRDREGVAHARLRGRARDDHVADLHPVRQERVRASRRRGSGAGRSAPTRFGSYSTVATRAGTPYLSRLKSIRR